MFTPDALRRIIRISLQPLTASRYQLYSEDAEEMLLMIAAHESELGKYLQQIGGGPALGLYQIEPATMIDNYKNFLNNRPELAKQISDVAGCGIDHVTQLKYNPIFGTIHARLKLYRSKGALPPANDPQAMAMYAKECFNSRDGAATPEMYLAAYRRLVASSTRMA
jgi:hypothetical protein